MDKECSIWLKGKGALTEKDHQFGPWLRASTSNLATKAVVKVAGLEEEDPNVGDQSSAKDSDDKEHGLTERENGRHSMNGLDTHEQGDNVGIRPGSLGGSGMRGEDFYASHTTDFIPKDRKLITPITVDSELPTIEEIVMHKRINESNFQVQLDAIDIELTKFDNGKGAGVDCGLGQEHHDDVHNGAVLNSSVVDFVKLNEGLS